MQANLVIRDQSPPTGNTATNGPKRPFDEVEALFSQARTPVQRAAAADAFLRDMAHYPADALERLCATVPVGEDHLTAMCTALADRLGVAHVKDTRHWEGLLAVTSGIAPESPGRLGVLVSCAQHMAHLKLDQPVLWQALLTAVAKNAADIDGKVMSTIAKAMAEAGVEAPAAWTQLVECAVARSAQGSGSPHASLAATLPRAACNTRRPG